MIYRVDGKMSLHHSREWILSESHHKLHVTEGHRPRFIEIGEVGASVRSEVFLIDYQDLEQFDVSYICQTSLIYQGGVRIKSGVCLFVCPSRGSSLPNDIGGQKE